MKLLKINKKLGFTFALRPRNTRNPGGGTTRRVVRLLCNTGVCVRVVGATYTDALTSIPDSRHDQPVIAFFCFYSQFSLSSLRASLRPDPLPEV